MFGIIRNPHGERIDYTLHPGKVESNDIVVIGHGVTGNKDRPFLIALAEGLAEVGISALRFSFSGNGDSEGAFTESTVTKEVEDLGAILEALSSCSITYVGHSMGGAVGVIRAAEDKRIQRLISLAGMVDTGAFAEREFGTEIPGHGSMWGETECPLSEKFMEDMKAIGSVRDLASRINVPWLLIHGTADDVVPIDETRQLFEQARQVAELVEFDGADHVFSGEFTDPMVATVVEWLGGGLSVEDAEE